MACSAEPSKRSEFGKNQACVPSINAYPAGLRPDNHNPICLWCLAHPNRSPKLSIQDTGRHCEQAPSPALPGAMLGRAGLGREWPGRAGTYGVAPGRAWPGLARPGARKAEAMAMAMSRDRQQAAEPDVADTQRPCARMSGTSPTGKATSRVQDTNTISMATGSPRWKKKRQLLENVYHTCKARRGRRRPSGTATQGTHFNDRKLRHAPDNLPLRKK